MVGIDGEVGRIGCQSARALDEARCTAVVAEDTHRLGVEGHLVLVSEGAVGLVDVEVDALQQVAADAGYGLVDGQQLGCGRCRVEDDRRSCRHLVLDLHHVGLTLAVVAVGVVCCHACRELIGERRIERHIVLAVFVGQRRVDDQSVVRVVHRNNEPSARTRIVNAQLAILVVEINGCRGTA